MTTTNDRLAEIRARLDAYNTRVQQQTAAKTARRPYHLPLGEAETDLNRNAPADLAHLLSLVDQLQGQLDEFATLQDRIPDDGNGDWGLGWDHGYNAALAEVRAMAARETAQEHASGPNAPNPYTGEGTAPTSPHEPAQAAIDTIARILVGTDWDEKVRYTDHGSRETVEQISGRISTAMAIAYYQQAARSLRALGHTAAADLLDSTARDLTEGTTNG